MSAVFRTAERHGIAMHNCFCTAKGFGCVVYYFCTEGRSGIAMRNCFRTAEGFGRVVCCFFAEGVISVVMRNCNSGGVKILGGLVGYSWV